MSGSTDMAALAIRLLFSLAVVIGLLALLSRVAGRRFKGRIGAPVQVVHRQPLSRGTAVAVVTVGTRVLVLGTTEHQVTLLTEVEPDEVGVDLSVPADGLEVDGLEDLPATPRATGPLAGSVLSPQTWRQALAAATAAQSRSRRVS